MEGWLCGEVYLTQPPLSFSLFLSESPFLLPLHCKFVILSGWGFDEWVSFSLSLPMIHRFYFSLSTLHTHTHTTTTTNNNNNNSKSALAFSFYFFFNILVVVRTQRDLFFSLLLFDITRLWWCFRSGILSVKNNTAVLWRGDSVCCSHAPALLLHSLL